MWNDRPIPPRTGTDSLAQKATAKKKKKKERRQHLILVLFS